MSQLVKTHRPRTLLGVFASLRENVIREGETRFRVGHGLLQVSTLIGTLRHRDRPNAPIFALNESHRTCKNACFKASSARDDSPSGPNFGAKREKNAKNPFGWYSAAAASLNANFT